MATGSWKSAKKKIIRAVDGGRVKTLSLDVFDTLLLRTTPPSFVTSATEARAADLLGVTPAEAATARGRAWNVETATAVSGGFDAEANSVPLFRRWVDLMVGGTEKASLAALFADELLRFELEAEADCLAINRELTGAVTYARANGVRIVAVSDMYLTSDQIGTLLGPLSTPGLIDLVVSSADTLLQKRSGRLFARCLSTPGVYFEEGRPGTADDVLHVGDDALADGIMARRAGMRSIVVADRREMDYRHGSHFELKRGTHVVAANAALRAERLKTSVGRSVGLSRFGPVYAGFIHAVAERAVRDRVSSVWFMAREGWMLNEIYGAVGKAGLVTDTPPGGYLYVSRLATLRAQLTKYGANEIKAAMDNSADKSYRNLLAPLCLTDDETCALVTAAGLDPRATATPEGIDRLAADAGFASVVAAIGTDELEGMKAYLLRTGFPLEGRVAVVDVGWGGQIQENLQKALSLMGATTEIVGYYLGTDARAAARRERGVEMHGLLVDATATDGRGLGAFSFVQGLEMATRSAHGSVVGYTSSGFPVLASADGKGRKAEAADDPLLADIQEGVLEYAGRYMRLAALGHVRANASLDTARDMVDLLALMPSGRDAQALLSLNNVANLGMDEGLLLGAKASLFSPRELKRVLGTTLWQEGTCAGALPFFGPLAFLLFRVAKRRIMKANPVPLIPAPEGDGTEVPVAFDPVATDVLGLSLTEWRSEVRYRSVGSLSAGRIELLSPADRFSLAVIRRAHSADFTDVKDGVIDMVKGRLRRAYRSPLAERAKSLRRMLY